MQAVRALLTPDPVTAELQTAPPSHRGGRPYDLVHLTPASAPIHQPSAVTTLSTARPAPATTTTPRARR
ncbi:hypothetical protein ACWD4G_31885 [Streptomyces sp. NPDC002643]